MFLFCCRSSVAYLTLSLLLLPHQVADAFVSKDLVGEAAYSHHNRLHRQRILFVTTPRRQGGGNNDVDELPPVFRRGGGAAQKGTIREREAQRRAQIRGGRFSVNNKNLEDSFVEKTVRYTSQFIQSADTKKNIPDNKASRKIKDNKTSVEDAKAIVNAVKGAGQFTFWATKGVAGLAWNSAKFAKFVYDKSQTQSSKKPEDRPAAKSTETLFSQPKISWQKAVEFIPLPKIVETMDLANTAAASTSRPDDITPVVMAAAKDVIKEEMQISAPEPEIAFDLEETKEEVVDRVLAEKIPAEDTTLFVLEELVSDVVTEKIPAVSPISTPAPETSVEEEVDERNGEERDTVVPEKALALSNDESTRTVLVEEEIKVVSPVSSRENEASFEEDETKDEAQDIDIVATESTPAISEDETPVVLAAVSDVVTAGIPAVSPVSAPASEASADEYSSSVESSAEEETSITSRVSDETVTSAEKELEKYRNTLLPIKTIAEKYRKPTYSLIKALYFPWIGLILSSESPSADIAPTSVSHSIFLLIKTVAEKYSKPTYSLIKALYFPWIGMIVEMQKNHKEQYQHHTNK